MPNLFASSPAVVTARKSILTPNLLGLYESQASILVSENGMLKSNILPVPIHPFTFKNTLAAPSPTPAVVNLSPTNLTRHWNPIFQHRPTPYPSPYLDPT
ncbi:hypothetical protein J008_03086 [Cryptococcus neoformans]|nr:hypothetical protein C362_02712 [Cryptococcus neoformans var. grubii Bt1]OXG26038.1 hypothetical protein C367_03010 [Cryptococcus neoformans var. grubii Ze90-1]OXH33112.1 hypothetical protein J008_03086 [Cryptococcus neoformans var. grubii]